MTTSTVGLIAGLLLTVAITTGGFTGLLLALVLVVLMLLYFRQLESGVPSPAIPWAMGAVGVALLVLRVLVRRRG